MEDNQNKQQPSGQGGQKQQQPLSWSQPGQKVEKEQQKLSTSPTAAHASTGIGNAGAGGMQGRGSRVALVFVIGLIVGWLVTWSWFDLRSNGQNSVATNATSTSEAAGTSVMTETQSGTSQSSTSGTMASGSSTPASVGSSQMAPTGQNSSDTITVPSPQPAGTSVTVSGISATGAVWAAVYEDNSGKPGRVLGAARFGAGEKSGTIPLLRGTLPNLNYFVGLLSDTPSHTFDLQANAPLLGSNGSQIMAQFMAQ